MGVVWKSALALLWILLDLSGPNVYEPGVLRSLATAVPGNIAVVLKDPGLFRVMASEETVHASYHGRGVSLPKEVHDRGEMFFPNLPLLHKVHFFWGYDSLVLREPFEVSRDIAKMSLKDGKPWFDLVNVKYLASPLPSLPEGFELIRQDPASNLFLNASAAGRAFLVPAGLVAKKAEGIDFEPAKKFESVEVPEYTPNRVRMTPRASGASWLFFSDTFYPGWKATVDGMPVKIWRAHRAFRAIQMPSGQHEVIWTYEPPLFLWGVLISLATLASMAFLLWKEQEQGQGG